MPAGKSRRTDEPLALRQLLHVYRAELRGPDPIPRVRRKEKLHPVVAQPAVGRRVRAVPEATQPHLPQRKLHPLPPDMEGGRPGRNVGGAGSGWDEKAESGVGLHDLRSTAAQRRALIGVESRVRICAASYAVRNIT